MAISEPVKHQLTQELIAEWTQEWLRGESEYANLHSFLHTKSLGYLPLEEDQKR